MGTKCQHLDHMLPAPSSCKPSRFREVTDLVEIIQLTGVEIVQLTGVELEFELMRSSLTTYGSTILICDKVTSGKQRSVDKEIHSM